MYYWLWMCNFPLDLKLYILIDTHCGEATPKLALGSHQGKLTYSNLVNSLSLSQLDNIGNLIVSLRILELRDLMIYSSASHNRILRKILYNLLNL